jgi:signal peptidase I
VIFLVILVAIVVLITVFLLLKFLFPLAVVEGDSMYPTLKEGEELICRRLFFKKQCKVNKIYVIHLRDDENKEPYYIIKRLDKVVKDNNYWFLGDNSLVSYDSRQYGSIKPEQVVAVVLRKVRKSNGS